MKRIILWIILLPLLSEAQGETGYTVHSHNDYLRKVPFWEALGAGAGSIEADVFLVGDSLFVAHTKEEIDTRRSLEALYLQPLQKMMAVGLEHPEKLQLLIDIKSEPYETLDTLVEILRKYPSIIENKALKLVISGNRPRPSEYVDYPDHIFFDHQSLESIENPSILEKIALISLNFKKFSEWNGTTAPSSTDLQNATAAIARAHNMGKPFRFWATPDSKTAWKVLVDLGVDYINTDMPHECTSYLESYRN